MEGHVGERIVVEAPRVGQPRREGEILEVIQGPGAPHYRVRWNDGRETIFFPPARCSRGARSLLTLTTASTNGYSL
jgi:hypothetical protein